MGVTISTHNGSAVSQDHNLRNKKVVDKQKHIDPNGQFEIWRHERTKEAYDRLFGEAVAEYNNRQNRADRKIDNYYKSVKTDTKKHPVYEMIVAIGSKKAQIEPNLSKDILLDFTRSWKARNPNLELIGAYYHADEEGVPHVHLDYIPVGHGYKNGPSVQNGLVKALGEMGFEKKGKATAQIQWQARENSYLEELCRRIICGKI